MPSGLDLGKQVGPLPMGAWVAIVAGGLGLGFFINRNQSKAPATSPVDQSVGVGGGQVLSPDDPTVATPTPVVEMDNEAWKRQAVNWLITQGQDPVAAELALRKYLDGQTLSVKERAMVALVLTKFGSQPEPIAPTPDTPTPVADPTPGITVTKYPTTVKQGRPLIIEGRIMKNGKPSAGVVEVELLRDDGVYRRTTADGAGISGKWNVILVAHPKGTRKYRLRVTFGKRSAYKDITIRVV